MQFLAARLAGKSVPNGCSQIKPGNSLAPAPVIQSRLLHFRWVGLRKPAKGVAVQVWAPHGAQKDVVVTLALSGRAVARTRMAKVTRRHETLVLHTGRAPKAGLYTVTVSVQGGTLVWQQRRLG
jgi:hypothetical protein